MPSYWNMKNKNIITIFTKQEFYKNNINFIKYNFYGKEYRTAHLTGLGKVKRIIYNVFCSNDILRLYC